MNIYTRQRASGLATSGWTKRLLLSALALAVSCVAYPQTASAFQDAQDSQQAAQPSDQNGAPQAPAYTPQTPEQLQQLVAPIALYPDSLVAQVLAASTFPAQIVEADRWVQDHPDLKGDALAQAVDQQNWDPSVKALTAFPSVLANMDKNLSWTSSLGDAYYNQQQDVMDAVQVMRQKAQANRQPENHAATNRRRQQGSTSSFSPPIRKSFTSRPIILGSFTAIPSRRGPIGISIPESGMAVRIFTSASVSESVSMAAMAGAGITGGPIGAVTSSSTTTTPTIRAATRFTTATTITTTVATTA